MKLLLKALPRNLPLLIRKQILVELFNATADAFECRAPGVNGLSYAKILQAYAQYTLTQTEKVLQSGSDTSALKSRLYRNACSLGEKVRRWSNVDSLEEVMELGQILYRAIGVEMQGNANGEVTISRCFFSHYYSAPVCDLISTLDDGIFSGISDGGRLAFSQRITECHKCCKARLLFVQEAH